MTASPEVSGGRQGSLKSCPGNLPLVILYVFYAQKDPYFPYRRSERSCARNWIMKTQGLEGTGAAKECVAVRRAGFGFARVVWRYCIFTGSLLAAGLPAQTLTTLHLFNGLDGDEPESPLLWSGGALYGVTRYGGIAANGVVFKVNTDGTGFSPVYKFTPSDADVGGAEPYGPLLVSGDAIYGTACSGVFGTVFKLNADGSGQNPLHVFSGTWDGAMPFGGVILSSSNLFGTTSSGDVFRVNTNGTGFAVLRCLSCDPAIGVDCSIYSGLLLIGDYLYGTTFTGGTLDYGIVFRVSTAGTGFSVLHDFQGSEGAGPWSGLLLYSNRLYGTTTHGGGTNSVGVIYAINADGTGFTKLHSFDGYGGGWPQGTLICSGNTLYGTTMEGGGIGGAGTVFSMKIDGTDFKTLYTFSGGADGAAPTAGVTLVGNDLYGTTSAGGIKDNGTIFRLSLPGPAAAGFVRSSNNLIVTWSTNTSGFALQSSTDLRTWTTVSNAPLMVNGTYAVTNSLSEPHRFFRLSR